MEAKNLNIQDLYDHFKNMFGEQYTGQNNTESDLNQNIACEELDAEFTYSELHSVIFMQKNNKSPGIDNIPCEIIKASYEFISPFLLKQYNRIYNTGEHPRSLGDGIITPIFKKGNANDAQNYRGIILINVIAKVYSQLLPNRITKWSVQYEKISEKQFGFQKGKFVTDCVFILHAIISKVLNSGEKLYCVFIIIIIISILEPCFPLPRVGLFDKSFSKASSPLRTILRVSRIHT